MNIGELKTIEFINQIELLTIKTNSENIVKDDFGQYNEKRYLENIVKEARELISYNEWLIALENTLDNLCEVDFKLNEDILILAETALNSSNSNRQSLISLLRK